MLRKRDVGGNVPIYLDGRPAEMVSPSVGLYLDEAIQNYRVATKAAEEAQERIKFWQAVVENWKGYPEAPCHKEDSK